MSEWQEKNQLFKLAQGVPLPDDDDWEQKSQLFKLAQGVPLPDDDDWEQKKAEDVPLPEDDDWKDPVQAQRFQDPAQAQRFEDPAQAQRFQDPAQAQRFQDPAQAQRFQDPVQIGEKEEFNYYNTWKKIKPALPAKKVLDDVFEKDYLPTVKSLSRLSAKKQISKDSNAIFETVYGTGVALKKDTDEYYDQMIKKYTRDINRLLDAIKDMSQELNIDFSTDHIKEEEDIFLDKKMSVEDIFQTSYWSGIVPEPPSSKKSNPLRLFQNNYSEIKRYEKSAEPALTTVDPLVVLQFDYINHPSSKRTYVMVLLMLYHKLELHYKEYLNYKINRLRI